MDLNFNLNSYISKAIKLKKHPFYFLKLPSQSLEEGCIPISF